MFLFLRKMYTFMISEVVSDNAIRHEREHPQILSDVREEDRAGARQVVQCMNNLRLANPKQVSLSRYDKYERLMFGTENEDRDSQDPLFGWKGRAPKANDCRRKWTEEEEAEIAGCVDLASMDRQPDAAVARELINKSRSIGGVIFGNRSGSALKNKLIRNWKMLRKNKDK